MLNRLPEEMSARTLRLRIFDRMIRMFLGNLSCRFYLYCRKSPFECATALQPEPLPLREQTDLAAWLPYGLSLPSLMPSSRNCFGSTDAGD